MGDFEKSVMFFVFGLIGYFFPPLAIILFILTDPYV